MSQKPPSPKRIRKRSPEYFLKKKIMDSNYYFKLKSEKPWKIVYHNVKKRCNNDSGYKGILCLMTEEDFKYLWFRDKAHLLKRPSIDRKDNKQNYTLENCEFIELSINSVKEKKGKRYVR